MNDAEWAEISENLFPEAAKWVSQLIDFPWHRDYNGQVTATRTHSSQALAVDFFGTLATLSNTSRIVQAWSQELGLPEIGTPSICLERVLSRDALGERRKPTQLDVSIEGEEGLLVLECKFTETDGGPCSQPIPLRKGPNRGKVQCTGDYVRQKNPVNGVQAKCALAGKGIRYWDVVPRVLEIDETADLRPCPFRGGWYQWMRNLVACAALAEKASKCSAFLVVYADGPFPMAKKVQDDDWAEFSRLTEGREVSLVAVSYQSLIQFACEAASSQDRPVLQRLAAWINRKITDVAATGEHGLARYTSSNVRASNQ